MPSHLGFRRRLRRLRQARNARRGYDELEDRSDDTSRRPIRQNPSEAFQRHSPAESEQYAAAWANAWANAWAVDAGDFPRASASQEQGESRTQRIPDEGSQEPQANTTTGSARTRSPFSLSNSNHPSHPNGLACHPSRTTLDSVTEESHLDAHRQIAGHPTDTSTEDLLDHDGERKSWSVDDESTFHATTLGRNAVPHHPQDLLDHDSDSGSWTTDDESAFHATTLSRNAVPHHPPRSNALVRMRAPRRPYPTRERSNRAREALVVAGRPEFGTRGARHAAWWEAGAG